MSANDPLRDPALDAAWRTHSTELPPPQVDAAILAAARREVHARPQPADGDDVADARGPSRAWWALAAAATVGAIAFGVVQLAPPPVVDETARVASDMPAASPGARSDAIREAVPAVPPPMSEAPLQLRPPEPAAPKPLAPGTTARESPRGPTDTPARTQSREGSEARLAEGIDRSTPVRDSIERTEREVARSQAMREQAEREAARSQVARAEAEREMRAPPVAPPSEPPSPAQPFPGAAAPSAGPSAAASAPSAAALIAPRSTPPTAQDARARSEATTRDPVHERATVAKATADTGPAAAWAERIRLLHEAGRLDDAARELQAFRRAHGDADARLAPSLRGWAATVPRVP